MLTPRLGHASLKSADTDKGRAPSLHLERATEVVVIGAGAFGGWTALRLQELGATVTLVDAYGPGNSRATSGDELRGIRPGYGDREMYTRWAIEALEEWKRRDEEWGRTLKRPLFMPTGRLILKPEWDADLEATKAALDKYGVRNEVLDHDEVARRWPQIFTDDIGVGFFEPDSGLLRARQATETVGHAFQQAGGKLVVGRAALGRQAGGRLAEVQVEPGGTISGQEFVFACGAWLPRILPDVMGSRLRTTRGHVFYVGTPPGDNRFMYPNLPNWDVPGSTGFPAQSHDNRGMRVRVGGAPPADPDTVERTIDAAGFEVFRSFMAQRFPLLADAPVLETRVCFFENSIDSHYIIDRHPGLENVWIVGGGSGHGFKNGPVVGDYTAKRVLGQERDPELAAVFRLKDDQF